MRLFALAGLAAVLALSGCNSGGRGGICGCDANTEVCLSGRCFPVAPTPTEEPAAARASCPAPTQVVGPAITTAAPVAGVCTPPLPASDTPELALPVLKGGVATVDPQVVGTELQFDLPAGTGAVTIVLQAVNVPQRTLTVRDTASGNTFQLDNTAVPLRLTAPDATTWYDDLQPLPADGSQQLVFFGSNSPLVGSLTVPNTTKALQVVGPSNLPAGRWTLVVNDFANECATVAGLSSQCGPNANITPAPNFSAYTTGTYRTTVLVRPGARPAQGTMNFGIYLQRCPGAEYDDAGACCVPSPGGLSTLLPPATQGGPSTCRAVQAPLTAASAVAGQDAGAARFAATLSSLVANGGICVGQITWYDLPEWAQATWRTGLDLDATACEVQLEQLLAVSQPAPVAGGQLNLFLVPDIHANNGASTAQVVGIDGTIPGPATFAGTVQSGAAVSASSLRDGASRCAGSLALGCGADLVAYIAAHEAGHYLGLYHVTESTGGSFDPLSDTFQCQCRSCLTAAQCTAGAEVTGTDCNRSTAVCGGGSNLMFWLLDSTSTGKLSPQQAEVMRASPLVR